MRRGNHESTSRVKPIRTRSTGATTLLPRPALIAAGTFLFGGATGDFEEPFLVVVGDLGGEPPSLIKGATSVMLASCLKQVQDPINTP
jgi:hypothetical protein